MNLKSTTTNGFNYRIINLFMQSWGVRLTWLDRKVSYLGFPVHCLKVWVVFTLTKHSFTYAWDVFTYGIWVYLFQFSRGPRSKLWFKLLFLFSGNNKVRGELDGPLLHMLNELRKEVSGQSLILQAPVVQKMDSAIHRINCYPVKTY